MNEPYDTNQPFEVIIDQIEDAIHFVSVGEALYTPKQILNTAYKLVFDTRLFQDECKEWRKLPEIEQTWDKFKNKFIEAHQDL